MKTTRIVTVSLLVLLIAVVAAWFHRRAQANEAPVYRFAEVERGDVQASVSATGTLGAVTTVQVGTQVSGQVAAIYVDFNDRVKKGQLIARIDPVLQQQAVRDAEASLERSQAELDQAEREYQRNRQLYERKVLTERELNTVEYNLAVARANVKSARVNLDRARQNLAYTSIYAPIDGVVVERNVDVGQTVAASLSAPQLFLIANDLTRMQILASVDESDIGLIQEGQPVRFTVQPYPDETFTGTVRQVRLQSTTVENVVNYTVVVEVANPGGKLLPGMTATVEFLTGAAYDVMTVPNAALRFRPTEAMLAELRERGQLPAGTPRAVRAGASAGPRRDNEPGARAQRTSAPPTSGQPTSAEPTSAQATSGEPTSVGGPGSSRVTRLWHLDRDGRLTVTPVRVGVSDGQRTAVEGPGVTEGMQVIVGVTQGQDGTAPTSPFQAPAQGGFRPPGAF